MYKKIILAAGLWILMFTACTKQKQYFEESGSVFHTIYHIKYEGSEILTEKIDAEFQKFNLSLNPFNPNSIISKVNRNEAVEADDWFIEVFNKAKEVSDHSEGIFDITCAPLVNLWGFGFSKMDSVTPQMIDSIKQFVGYQKVRLDGRKVVKDDSRILLNCSAIAKGYASDVIARLLEREGIENYMVEIGGEVTMKGVNQNGKCWRIGINKPEDDSTGIKNDIEEVVQLCKKGGIAESSYDKLKEGMTVMVTSWNTGNSYEATITSIGNSPVESMKSSENPNMSYYPFTAVVEKDADLSSGEGVSISVDGLSGDSGNSIYLEQMFIREGGNRSYVYKKGKHGRLEKQYVEVGKNMYGSIEIVSGLTMEDEIAFPYGRNVKEGAKTKTVESLYDYN